MERDERAMKQHQEKREGTPLPPHPGSVTARVENFDALDSDCFNLNLDDAYDILGRLFDEFTIGYCRLSTDEIYMIPTLLEVPTDARDENIKAHFEFSRFETIGAERLIAYYNYKCT
jgi:hypothetical protein